MYFLYSAIYFRRWLTDTERARDKTHSLLGRRFKETLRDASYMRQPVEEDSQKKSHRWATTVRATVHTRASKESIQTSLLARLFVLTARGKDG